jgi:hypothetical protein
MRRRSPLVPGFAHLSRCFKVEWVGDRVVLEVLILAWQGCGGTHPSRFAHNPQRTQASGSWDKLFLIACAAKATRKPKEVCQEVAVRMAWGGVNTSQPLFGYAYLHDNQMEMSLFR